MSFLFPGSCFVRTDQLDGETDWKLRLPVACTQRLPTAAVSRTLRMTVRVSESVEKTHPGVFLETGAVMKLC